MAKDKKKKKDIIVLDKADIEGRKKALQKAMLDIEEEYGKGSIMRLGEYKTEDIEVIPTGALALDVALGVDIERLIVSQPDNGEEALEITEKLIRSSAVDLVVVDSVAALVPKAEIEGNMGDSHMALQARLMSQALRKIAGQMNKTNTTVIFINQIREKVGVLYGSPEVTPGGRALKFYSSVRIDIRKADKILESGVMVGNKTKVKIVKNKVAAPFKEVMLTMRYGKGLDTEGDIINLAIDFGVVEKAGSWFSYNGERIGQGRDKVREYMEANPDKKEEIEEKVKQMARENTSYGMMEDDDSDVDTDTTEE